MKTKTRTLEEIRLAVRAEVAGLAASGKRLAMLYRELRRTEEYRKRKAAFEADEEYTPETFRHEGMWYLAATLDDAVKELRTAAGHLDEDTRPETWAALPARAWKEHEEERSNLEAQRAVAG